MDFKINWFCNKIKLLAYFWLEDEFSRSSSREAVNRKFGLSWPEPRTGGARENVPNSPNSYFNRIRATHPWISTLFYVSFTSDLLFDENYLTVKSDYPFFDPKFLWVNFILINFVFTLCVVAFIWYRTFLINVASDNFFKYSLNF